MSCIIRMSSHDRRIVPRVITDIRFIRSRWEPPASNTRTIRHAADSLRMFYRVTPNLVDHVDRIRRMADGSSHSRAWFPPAADDEAVGDNPRGRPIIDEMVGRFCRGDEVGNTHPHPGPIF